MSLPTIRLWRLPDVVELESTESRRRQRDETGFHSDLTDIFESEIIVKADFVHQSTWRRWGIFFDGQMPRRTRIRHRTVQQLKITDWHWTVIRFFATAE